MVRPNWSFRLALVAPCNSGGKSLLFSMTNSQDKNNSRGGEFDKYYIQKKALQRCYLTHQNVKEVRSGLKWGGKQSYSLPITK